MRRRWEEAVLGFLEEIEEDKAALRLRDTRGLVAHTVDQGLNDTEVECRRKYSGWNELMTEKENLFKAFIGYFRGPILYGELFVFHRLGMTTFHRLTSPPPFPSHGHGTGCSFGLWPP